MKEHASIIFDMKPIVIAFLTLIFGVLGYLVTFMAGLVKTVLTKLQEDSHKGRQDIVYIKTTLTQIKQNQEDMQEVFKEHDKKLNEQAMKILKIETKHS